MRLATLPAIRLRLFLKDILQLYRAALDAREVPVLAVE